MGDCDGDDGGGVGGSGDGGGDDHGGDMWMLLSLRKGFYRGTNGSAAPIETIMVAIDLQLVTFLANYPYDHLLLRSGVFQLHCM